MSDRNLRILSLYIAWFLEVVVLVHWPVLGVTVPLLSVFLVIHFYDIGLRRLAAHMLFLAVLSDAWLAVTPGAYIAGFLGSFVAIGVAKAWLGEVEPKLSHRLILIICLVWLQESIVSLISAPIISSLWLEYLFSMSLVAAVSLIVLQLIGSSRRRWA